MKSLFVLIMAFPLLLVSSPAHAQDKGPWRAESSTARTITGDIEITDSRLMINFAVFPLANIRSLTVAEASAAFDADRSAPGGGFLYRLRIPAEKRFQHRNTLCGSDETQWMATWESGPALQVAFFSGDKMPILTLDALNGSPAVCGIYGYVR